jgi:hypothetical protein
MGALASYSVHSEVLRITFIVMSSLPYGRGRSSALRARLIQRGAAGDDRYRGPFFLLKLPIPNAARTWRKDLLTTAEHPGHRRLAVSAEEAASRSSPRSSFDALRAIAG